MKKSPQHPDSLGFIRVLIIVTYFKNHVLNAILPAFILFYRLFSLFSFTVEAQNTIKRLYYSISEASQLVDEEQYVLRYWETEFEQLRPQKNRAGNRIYTEKEIELLRAIKHLLREKRYTVDGAKEHLKHFSDNDSDESNAAQFLTNTNNKDSQKDNPLAGTTPTTSNHDHSEAHTTNGKQEITPHNTSNGQHLHTTFSHEELLALRSTLREMLALLESSPSV